MTTRDEILEEIALYIEGRQFRDFASTLSRRKRDREDADLRARVALDERTILAREVRGMKGDDRYDPVRILQRIASHDGEKYPRGYQIFLTEAWPLVWKGLVNIYAEIKCNSNSLPPETCYRIEITEHGRDLLSSATTTTDREG